MTIKDFTPAQTLSLELRNVRLATVGTEPTSTVTINGIFDATGVNTSFSTN